MPKRSLPIGIACALLALAPGSAAAQDQERWLSIGAGVHLLSSLEDVCERGGDVVGCSTMRPFAGADLSAHLWAFQVLGVGVRVAGSKDLDGSELQDSDGSRSDRDQWLWRLSLEGRVDPPLLPRGLWISAEVGLAFMVDSLDEVGPDGDELRSASATQEAWLLGTAIGWDFALGEQLLLGFELRGQLIGLPEDPPELQGDIEAVTFGSAPWLGLGLRLTYQP